MKQPHTNQSNAFPRLMRLDAIVGPKGCIPVSASSWWAGVKSGRYPQPVKLGPRTTAWKSEDIQKLIDNGVANASASMEGLSNG